MQKYNAVNQTPASEFKDRKEFLLRFAISNSDLKYSGKNRLNPIYSKVPNYSPELVRCSIGKPLPFKYNC